MTETALQRADLPPSTQDNRDRELVALGNAGVWSIVGSLGGTRQHTVELVVRGTATAVLKRPLRNPGRSLRREFEFLKQFSGSGLVSPLAYGKNGDHDWLLLDYVPGGDLRSLAGAVPGRWLPILAQPLGWLVRLHGVGYVHRDIKLSNLMVDSEGRGVVIDLGELGLASERLEEVPVDGNVHAPIEFEDDVYAFGQVLYELCTGGVPPTDETLRYQRLQSIRIPDVGIALINEALDCRGGLLTMQGFAERVEAWKRDVI